MKGSLIFLTLLAVVLAAKIPNKYDNVDVDKILGNDRILNNYIRCLMDEGSCTAEGRELKKTLPNALSSGCDECNDIQRSTAIKVIDHLRTKRPRDWERLTAKYDARGEYKKRYETLLATKRS
ncbi:ejaculatory bulb-specific protein 3-like [Athalia rosae]|uniref:ejaculatory bulb-specific protein 3-like n=1 Tax=Athalia rosae TaxID=37344 RepID=UPI0020349B2A|nr:ejaculatory bulb-specific protein 3-like [Athalia rosae]